MYMNKDEYYMSIALEEAKKAFELDEVPVGCVLVCNDEIVAKGHNTKEKNKNVIYHAEINCLLEASRKLDTWHFDDCVIYVTLEPCPMCASAIQQARIKRIVYGATDEKTGACGGLFDLFLIPKLNHYPFLTSGVLEKECKEILLEYFKNKRQK